MKEHPDMKNKKRSWYFLLITIFLLITFIYINASGEREIPAHMMPYGSDQDFSDWVKQIALIDDPDQKKTQQAAYESLSFAATGELRISLTKEALGCFIDPDLAGCEELAGTVTSGITDDLHPSDFPKNQEIINAWIGNVEGQETVLYAGYFLDNPEQGFVVFRAKIGQDTLWLTIASPKEVGGLKIEHVVGSRVELSTSIPDNFLYFDLLAISFVSDMDVIVPTATPRPAHFPPDNYPTPSPTWNPYPITGFGEGEVSTPYP